MNQITNIFTCIYFQVCFKYTYSTHFMAGLTNVWNGRLSFLIALGPQPALNHLLNFKQMSSPSYFNGYA